MNKPKLPSKNELVECMKREQINLKRSLQANYVVLGICGVLGATNTALSFKESLTHPEPLPLITGLFLIYVAHSCTRLLEAIYRKLDHTKNMIKNIPSMETLGEKNEPDS